MKHAKVLLTAAAVGGWLTASAGATVVLSDGFGRTTGLADTVANGGSSNWGSNDNALGGTASAAYLTTTSTTNNNQQTVEGGVGALRSGRTLLNYNLATDAAIISAGGFIVETTISPSDVGGSGAAGRDWGAVILSDTNSIIRFGGAAGATNGQNDNIRGVFGVRNSGSLLQRTNNSADVDAVSTATGNLPNADDANDIRRFTGNPLGAFNEAVFDAATLAAYTTMAGNSGYAGNFVSSLTYNLRLEVTSSQFGQNNGNAFVRVFIDNAEMDLDTVTAGVQGIAFKFGNGSSVTAADDGSGVPIQGGLYLGFVGNASTGTIESGNVHLFDMLVVSTIPEPATAALLGLGGLSMLARRRSA